MAQKPDGKAARTERVTFTRPAAERIAKVVRTVEGGGRDAPGIRFGTALGAQRPQEKVFRVCTFTGAWDKAASKTVTFRGVTATPNTVSAVNLFTDIKAATGSKNCAVAKDGTAWYLIAAEC